MIDRRLLTHFDWITLMVTVALAASGFATIYSATFTGSNTIYMKEIYWLIIGTVFLILAISLNYSILERFAYPIYGASLLLLIAVLLFGKATGGATRWLDLGFISFQPSELAKLALIVALAKHFSSRAIPPRGLGLKELGPPFALMLVPFALIAKEPDLGTALITWMIFWSIVLTIKVRRRIIAGILLLICAFIPVAWMGLKGYQKARITGFLTPETDPLGAGYHLIQSKIAIGSGGYFGKGFTMGTQGKLMFLPEQHTDFIFSVLSEEWGLAGSLIVLALFLILILRGLNCAENSKDKFGFLVALGISAMLFWHMIFNLGMVSGLLPVVGVPLPFISYGGSFLISSMIAVGLLINIKIRRFIF